MQTASSARHSPPPVPASAPAAIPPAALPIPVPVTVPVPPVLVSLLPLALPAAVPAPLTVPVTDATGWWRQLLCNLLCSCPLGLCMQRGFIQKDLIKLLGILPRVLQRQPRQCCTWAGLGVRFEAAVIARLARAGL